MAGSGFKDGRSCVANLHQVSHKPIERSFRDDLRLGLIVVNCKVRSIELFLAELIEVRFPGAKQISPEGSATFRSVLSRVHSF